ncbi:TNT domain-containing protein [Kutzneria sp. CA-103260]|uniref:TNT domain-containing protein n=1 Tax=Kutzneria sp. CA-103260 TaxID=2802641 RepID=UPI002012EFB3|nr:TNT domain-containing protein [Kutzneria sp. CA-103260]
MTVAGLALVSGPVAAQAVSRSTPPTECSAAFFDNDRRLGPLDLPTAGPLGRVVRGYKRTGDLSIRQFLARFWDPEAKAGAGGWRYPPGDGYVIGPDGRPEVSQRRLAPGVNIDRFGDEGGSFLAPEGLSYTDRSIPPQNLVGTPPARCDYHDYRVVRPFIVDSGPVAPWFRQAGGGTQYQLDSRWVSGAPAKLTVTWLLEKGYLERVR